MERVMNFSWVKAFFVPVLILFLSVSSLASSYGYDLNSDNSIGLPDLALFVQQWLDANCISPDWCYGSDFDQSGNVDFNDFALFAQHWGDQLTPPVNLVGWWQLDQGFGTIAYDSVADKDGTLTNMNPATAWVAGYNSKAALNFDGIDDSVTVPALNINTVGVTLSAWIKRSGNQTDYAGIIYRRYWVPDWYMYVEFGLQFGTDNELRYRWNNTYYQWSSGLVPPDNQWVFVALVIEPSQATIYLYDNEGLKSAVDPHAHSQENWSGTLSIGRASTASGRLYRGAIDDVRIYNAALTADDLRTIIDRKGYAESPRPKKGEHTILPVTLSWTSGQFVQPNDGHLVYLSDNFNDVNTATTDSNCFLGPYDVNNVAPTGLAENHTYYWRVDEVNSTDPNSPWKGSIWSVRVIPPILLRVFLLAGQSNMVGSGASAELPSQYQGEQKNVIIYASGTVDPGLSDKWIYLKPGLGGASNAFGPEITFGHDIAAALTDCNVALIKLSIGGTPLHDLAGPTNSWKARIGSLYFGLLNITDLAISKLDRIYQPVISGMLWMQGENDASYSSTSASQYRQNLIDLIDDLRADLPVSNMPFMIGQIANHYPPSGWAWGPTVQAAEQRVGDEKEYCNWFTTDDLAMNADYVHYNAAGQIILGQRFAAKMIPYWTPNPYPVPASYSYSNGSFYSGLLANLTANDNVSFVSQSQTSGTTRYATVAFTFTGIPVSSPSSIDVTVLNRSGTASTTQKIRLYNFATTLYDEKDSTTIGTAESTRSFTVTTGASNYISGGTVYVQQECSKATSTTFYIYHDQLALTVHP